MLKIIKFIISLFSKAGKVLSYVDEAITIVQTIKIAFSSDLAIELTKIIPGDWDDLVRMKVVYALNKASILLWKVEECEGATTGEAKVACYLKWLKIQTDDVKAVNYARIALLIAKELASSLKLTEAELNALIQTRYVQLKKDNSL
ncbi:hypothetical protein QNI19_14550 [Cytophagaceae bacterium DM2B3-1]|uniref:Uncharacterized protein n=1 Tax=Xanthocytophaga flava TaxID=3048013 RepID=A0ABT7CK89_9BACT|nr:hypothetical protein [Xanthocytophaga flavus]MDJ1494160.1 hypothetical protein [Xanthocytophaga flavus]